MEIRKALAVIRRSKTSRKQVSVKWVVGRDSNFSGLVFGLLTFSGESAAEYAANSGLLRKRIPSSPPIFARGGEEASSNPKMGGEEIGILLPYRYQQFVKKFVEKERSPKEKKLSKMVPK